MVEKKKKRGMALVVEMHHCVVVVFVVDLVAVCQTLSMLLELLMS